MFFPREWGCATLPKVIKWFELELMSCFMGPLRALDIGIGYCQHPATYPGMWLKAHPKRAFNRDELWAKTRSKLLLAGKAHNGIKKGIPTLQCIFSGVYHWCRTWNIKLAIIFKANNFDHWPEKHVVRFMACKSHIWYLDFDTMPNEK